MSTEGYRIGILHETTSHEDTYPHIFANIIVPWLEEFNIVSRYYQLYNQKRPPLFVSVIETGTPLTAIPIDFPDKFRLQNLISYIKN